MPETSRLMSEEQQRLEENLSVIRHYLHIRFPSHDITEIEDHRLFQKFSVMSATRGTHYQLKVLWPRLMNPRSTPTQIHAELEREGVARQMATRKCVIW